MIKKRKSFPRREQELDQFKTLITHYNDDDFDGHTNFEKLSPEQKLCWLSCCAYFLAQIKSENTGPWPAMDGIPVDAMSGNIRSSHAPEPGL